MDIDENTLKICNVRIPTILSNDGARNSLDITGASHGYYQKRIQTKLSLVVLEQVYPILVILHVDGH